MGKDKNIKFNQNKDRRTRYCQRAPEWAEHARFDADDEPCDDGFIAVIESSKGDVFIIGCFCQSKKIFSFEIIFQDSRDVKFSFY